MSVAEAPESHLKIAIMQPYFLPYIGYFQLINAADLFIIYDNIEYTKKGWINRNRFLVDGRDILFTVPLRKGSDFSDIRDREVSADFNKTRLLDRIRIAYARAPYFSIAYNEIREIVFCDEVNLFKYVLNSVRRVCAWLSIPTRIVASSEVLAEHKSLKSQEKVIALCKAVQGGEYINPVGGRDLYDSSEFARHGLRLSFLRSESVFYRQFDHRFVPNLSIIDVMMFNSPHQVRPLLQQRCFVD